MSTFRALPAQPSLEFERKEAKMLLRQLRAGHPEALERAHSRHAAIKTVSPDTIQLADAQLVIAREYGFTSWPKLVRYFGDLHRLLNKAGSMSHSGMWTPHAIEASVATFVQSHKNRRVSAWRALTAYVPRFYELPIDDVFDIAITEDEAKLALARRQGFVSWDAMITRATQARQTNTRNEFDLPPIRLAGNAMRAGDLKALKQLVAAHSELRYPNEYQMAVGLQVPRLALQLERELGRETMRPILTWLESEGFNIQSELNVQLCGGRPMTLDSVRYLLDRGANPIGSRLTASHCWNTRLPDTGMVKRWISLHNARRREMRCGFRRVSVTYPV